MDWTRKVTKADPLRVINPTTHTFICVYTVRLWQLKKYINITNIINFLFPSIFYALSTFLPVFLFQAALTVPWPFPFCKLSWIFLLRSRPDFF